MSINGVWTGEYITHWFTFKTGREVAVPFVMKVQSINGSHESHTKKELFEGICQDDPEISKITTHAKIAGSLWNSQLFLIKQYPQLMIRTDNDEIEAYEGPHPEIIYKGEFKKDRFSGLWHMNRTFRTINGKLCELMPINGSWRMKKL